MINRAMQGLVASRSAITDQIENRLFGIRIPQGTNTLPFAYFRTVPSPRNRDLRGITGLQDTTVDLFVYADNQTDLEELLQTFETELDSKSGVFNGVRIHHTYTLLGGMQEWSEDQKAFVGRIELKITIKRG